MKKIEIFDPAMCCSTGVCGPSVEPDLIRISLAVHNLQQNGVDIKRFNLASEPGMFTENNLVNDLLQSKGADVLPLVLIDGKVFKESVYPTNEEFAELTGISLEDLGKKKVVRLNLNVK